MKNKFFLSLVFILIFSCGKEEIDYLYDKEDGNYKVAEAALRKKCLNDSVIFDTLDKTSTFSNFFTKKDERVFKISTNYSKGAFTEKRQVYIRLNKHKYDTNNGTMEIAVAYSENSTPTDWDDNKNKIIVYTQLNNKNLLKTIQMGICSKKYDLINGGNNEFVKFSDERILKSRANNKDYVKKKQSETYNFVVGYPAIFAHWTLSRTIETKKNLEAEVVTTSYKPAANYSIVELAENADCEGECRAVYDVNLPKCQLLIDTDHYNAKAPETVLTSFSSCVGK